MAQTDSTQSMSPEKADDSIPEQNSSSRLTAVAIAVIFVSLVGWYVASDRLAPYSSKGSVSAYVTQLSPLVAGQVTQVFVNDGEVVAAGQPLFQINDQAFRLAVKQAENDLARSIKSTKASAASLVSNQAAVNEARINLENTQATTNRTLALAKRNLLSSSDADNARAQLKAAEAALVKSEAALESALLSLGSDDEQNLDVQASHIKLEQAQLNLAYSTVRAPTQGVITNLNLAIGHYVAPGNPAMTFIDARGAWISIDLRENQLGNVDVGDEVDVSFDAVPGTTFKGKVTAVAWGIDPGKATANGLQKTQPSNQWFEPARNVPVHIELVDGLTSWPKTAKAGGKVSAVIYAEGKDNLVAWFSSVAFKIKAFLSYLH